MTDGIDIWPWSCPECEAVEYHLPPEEGDLIDCSECDWWGIVAEIEDEEEAQ